MDLWTVCERGHVHWGQAGGAGFLFRYLPERGEASYLLLQRSKLVDYAGTWGVPGGARRHGESPEATARREAEEEVGTLPSYRVTGVNVQDCGGGWKFHLVTADVDDPFLAYCGKETDATGWFTQADMQNMNLHPGLRRWLDEQESGSP